MEIPWLGVVLLVGAVPGLAGIEATSKSGTE